jgi:hypothetical protein
MVIVPCDIAVPPIPGGVTGFGKKATLMPFGALAVKATELSNFSLDSIVTVTIFGGSQSDIISGSGATESLKRWNSMLGMTLRVTCDECVMPTSLPTIFNV